MFIIGQDEGLADQLRSILAQYQFQYEIQCYEADGVPFGTFLYIPELHPETKATFYEREDEAHLIKVNEYIALNYCVILMFYFSVLQVILGVGDQPISSWSDILRL